MRLLHWLFHAVGWLFENLPDLSAFLFAAVALGIAFMPSEIKKLEERPKLKWFLVSLCLLVGVGGWISNNIQKSATQTAHNSEVREFNQKIASVGTLNTQILDKLVSSPEDPKTKEITRKKNILALLRNEYILSHKNISPGLFAGTEWPPSDWMNKRLRELGEAWIIPAIKPRPQIAGIEPEPSEKAKIDFSFYTEETDIAGVPGPKEISMTAGPVIAVDIQYRGIGEVTAKNGAVFVRICDECTYAEEPEGFAKVADYKPQDREKHFVAIYPNVTAPKITIKLMPSLRKWTSIKIGCYYACENCPPVDPRNPQILTIKFVSSKGTMTGTAQH